MAWLSWSILLCLSLVILFPLDLMLASRFVSLFVFSHFFDSIQWTFHLFLFVSLDRFEDSRATLLYEGMNDVNWENWEMISDAMKRELSIILHIWERERNLESFGDRIQYDESFMRRWSRGRAAEAFNWRWRYDMQEKKGCMRREMWQSKGAIFGIEVKELRLRIVLFAENLWGMYLRDSKAGERLLRFDFKKV